MKKWKTLSSKKIVDERWLKLRADRVELPDGSVIDDWYVTEYTDWITVLAVDTQLNAQMVRIYRHGGGIFSYEMVGGIIDEGETPEAAANRELAEELGYTGGTLYKTGATWMNPANQTHQVHMFLSVGGSVTRPPQREADEVMEAEPMPLKDLWTFMARSGQDETFQSNSLANMYMAMNFIRESHDPALAPLKTTLPR